MKIPLIITFLFLSSIQLYADNALEPQIEVVINPQAMEFDQLTLEKQKAEQEQPPKLIPGEPKAATLETPTQFPPEPAKMEYLRSMINPGKKHQFAARCAAMVLGNACRVKHLKALRRKINNTIDEAYEKQTKKIFTPKAMFLFMMNYGIRFSLFLAKMGISLVELAANTETATKKLKNVNWLAIEDNALFLSDILVAKKLNDWFLPEKDRDLLLAGAGGSTGTLGYILYYKFFFSDMVCLERTLNCFKNSPENFPASAFMILKKAESLMDKNALDTKTAALVCEQLRGMSQIK